jgi:hypothetical protein
MATINKGEADRSILNTVGIPDKFVDKTDDDKKIKAPPGGSIVVATDMTNIDAFIEAQDAAKECGKKSRFIRTSSISKR